MQLAVPVMNWPLMWRPSLTPHSLFAPQLVFHFQTLLDNFERTVIDDSRLAGRPAEIFVGKMFKMEVWETLLTSMRIGEVAEFWCDAVVRDPMSYHRESWMMEKDEKLQTVPTLHMQGNALVKQRRFSEAASKYKEAVLLLKTVQSKEMPGDIDYINLGRMIVPLELNYCQCMLELEEYYEVIEHTTELLEKHKGKNCVKGYYKRAKAHAAVWNEKEARRDFNMVAQLDVTLARLIHRELNALSERMREKYWEEKEKYWNMLEKQENKNESEQEEEETEKESDDKQQRADDETCASFLFLKLSPLPHLTVLPPPPTPSIHRKLRPLINSHYSILISPPYLRPHLSEPSVCSIIPNSSFHCLRICFSHFHFCLIFSAFPRPYITLCPRLPSSRPVCPLCFLRRWT
uniref:Aryl hydrocarbon receptor interacting protein like 2 n=1 Tax=Salarias fasciatus TaxID=181472 RepID=A0A672JAP7_SALFA